MSDNTERELRERPRAEQIEDVGTAERNLREKGQEATDISHEEHQLYFPGANISEMEEDQC